MKRVRTQTPSIYRQLSLSLSLVMNFYGYGLNAEINILPHEKERLDNSDSVLRLLRRGSRGSDSNAGGSLFFNYVDANKIYSRE